MATILIIDDDPDVTRLIEFALKRANHKVLTAKDGETGLSITQAEHPHLVIADVMMPKLNGYEYCRRVRAQEELADIHILVFSARFQPIDRQTALEAGATDYMPKTVRPSDLVAHVERILSKSPSSAQIKLGHVITVFSLRGGVGVTSIAVNLSVALALTRRHHIALVDMAPLSGHVALMLGLRPGSGLRRALGTGRKTDLETLKRHWQTHESGVQVLPSTVSPQEAGEVSPAAVQPLTTELRQTFSLAFLDLPPMLSGATAAALSAADRILLIVTPETASLQSTAVALEALNTMGVENQRIWAVLNTPGGVAGLSPETVAKSLKQRLVAHIPYEPDMVAAVNARRPLMLASPQSAGAQAIARLAAQLLA